MTKFWKWTGAATVILAVWGYYGTRIAFDSAFLGLVSAAVWALLVLVIALAGRAISRMLRRKSS